MLVRSGTSGRDGMQGKLEMSPAKGELCSLPPVREQMRRHKTSRRNRKKLQIVAGRVLPVSPTVLLGGQDGF